jgi:DNA-binding response OmpR family regulator
MLGDGSAIAGLGVFLVEDETLIALMIEEHVADIGCVLRGTAASVEQALEMVEDLAADVAILDVNLDGCLVFPVCERLAVQEIPFVFSTGYGRQGIPDQWCDRPVLQKPYGPAELAAAISAALRLGEE